MRTERVPQVAILGAGPVGLDAALAAADAGWPFTVYEAAEPAAHVRAWGHLRLFSPWSLNVSPRMRVHLADTGIEVPAGDACPTGHELAGAVLEPLARLPQVASCLRTATRVVAVGRAGLGKHHEIGTGRRAAHPFRLLLRSGDREWTEGADVVLDATGTWSRPNPVGDGGIPAPGEADAGERIVRRIPDLDREADAWAGRRVVLVGQGHSAQTAARALAVLAERAPGTRVIWAIRRAGPDFGAVEDDPLPERAALTTRARELAAGASEAVEVRTGVRVDALARTDDGVEVTLVDGAGGRKRVRCHRVLGLTGSVGDAGIYRQLQVHECYATAAPMKLSAALLASGSADCLAQGGHAPDVLTNPEPDFFVIGVKSYGTNNTFLLKTGWEQVDQVFGLLAAGGRWATAALPRDGGAPPRRVTGADPTPRPRTTGATGGAGAPAW